MYKTKSSEIYFTRVFLNRKAKDLYSLDNDVSIQYLPNPVEIDNKFDFDKHNKKNNIIFLVVLNQ